MAKLGKVNVEWNGESHTIVLSTIHTVWAEEALGKSSDGMGAMTLAYAMAWQALAKSGVDVPSDFAGFLALEPDLEQIEGPEAGKDGTVALTST